ncbi:MAG: alpha/beta fold hydrolase, partial [Pseudomonadota bacterium]
IAEGTDFTYAWFVDRDGEPAFRFNTNRRGSLMYIYAREERGNGKVKWRKIQTIRLNRVQEELATAQFDPLFPGPTVTTYYVAARPDDADKTGIYLYDFEKDEILETVYTHPDVDVSNAIYNRETNELQGYYFFDDKLRFEFESDQVQRDWEQLDAHFGDQLNVLPLMSNRDGTRWLVETKGATDAGSYHLYELAGAKTRFLGSRMNSLANKALGHTQVVRYTARDGLALFGYLTRPAATDDSARPPLIMLPHGGPEARDLITYNQLVQVLVARGYQVFQPNFRGSSGFGKAFADLGRGQWGRAMQTDVDDALAHLIETGLADEQRACILGISYGGYVALAAATLTPDLYRCTIAIAAPSHLVEQLKWDRKEEGRRSEAYKYWVEHIGDPRKDRDRLNAVSPALLADNITSPVLLIHGQKDRVVPIEQTELMVAALEAADKPFEHLVLDNSSHGGRSKEDRRTELERVLAFLEEHLPAKGAVEADQAEGAQPEALPGRTSHCLACAK